MAISGYRFDATYRDVPGGTYRIYIASGPLENQVTITGEGRDSGSKETRSIVAVYTNTSVPGAIIAGGNLSASEASVVHWGPVMAMGDITVSGGALKNGYPRKLSRQTVKPFDTTNDTNPPNTDSLEWWSDYNVPELPVFDFTSMRSSAAATDTLDCQDATVTTTVYNTVTDPIYSCVGKDCTEHGSNCDCVDNHCDGSGCVDSGSNCSCSGSGSSKVCSGSGCKKGTGTPCSCTAQTCTGTTCTDPGGTCVCTTSGYTTHITTTTTSNTGMYCCHSDVYGGAVTCDYPGSPCTNCAVSDLYDQTTLRDKDYTWFWDNNASWSGDNGLKGTIIVKGDLSIDGGDYYCSGCTVAVPPNAWKEYQKYDTTAVDQYPGDTGLHSNAATYTFGSNASSTCSGSPSLITKGELWRMPCGTSGLGADLGVYGFLYIGGNFTRTGDSDIYGSMWVAGNVTGSGNTMVLYNSHLKLPTLNVVLTKDSWQEINASTVTWQP